MTRAERTVLAKLLEEAAAALEAAESQAKNAADASGCDPLTTHAYQTGHLQAATRAGAARIRAAVREFLAPRATDSRRRRRPQRGTAIPRIA